MGGKVLVSTTEMKERLVACRLQADMLNSPLVVIGRTDAESASMIDNNMDPVDHPFIKGRTVATAEPLHVAIQNGRAETWEELAGSMTFPKALAQAMESNGQDTSKWLKDSLGMSLPEMRQAAAELGHGNLHFDWDANRSSEGYYRIDGSTEYCIRRALAWAPYADSLWMETAKPIRSQAEQFATAVRSVYPHQMLSYNLSPSFNWDTSGMTDQEMETFVWDLAKLGFNWQFITLAGFHCNALGIDMFARDYAKRGAAAYVQLIQRQEREHGVETLTHQKWSGAELIDSISSLVSGGRSSTGIMSTGVTETQFAATSSPPLERDFVAQGNAKPLWGRSQ
jgi:isocitrate lyase